MSFDTTRINYEQYFRCVSIPFEQGDVFRLKSLKEVRELVWSQSLSSRAMSFDLANELKQDCTLLSLNPFRAGRCLSTQKWWDVEVVNGLNPFRAGRCLSTSNRQIQTSDIWCLNPFRAGRCLSTYQRCFRCMHITVSIPFEQGDVFRRQNMIMLMSSKRLNPFRAGQCLSTFQMALKRKKSLCLNPFRAGRCLSTMLFDVLNSII